MRESFAAACKFVEPVRERDRIGVWGFGNVSRDVVFSLAHDQLGKEIVFYGRPKGEFSDRAGAWVGDFKANIARRPRLIGTNRVEDMAGLDVIFVGVGAPRKPGMSRDDLLALNTEVIAKTTLEIRDVYQGCSPDKLPILVYMGNPVTCMTWVGYKASGFPKANIMGQAGNLDSRRIAQAIAGELGLSGSDVHGVVFGDHGDSMVATPEFFSVNGIPLLHVMDDLGVDRSRVQAVIDEAKKGGTHFVQATGQSASAGPARAACEMLRTMVRGEFEIQPVVAVVEKEYGLIDPEDGLESMGFGVPAKIGPHGVEKIVELPVDGVREDMKRSAGVIKGNIQAAARILKEKFDIA